MKAVKELKNLKLMPTGNRNINPQHVEELKQEINRAGLLRDIIVVKTDLFGKTGYYIVDGQHLYMACIALDMLSELEYKLCKINFKTLPELVEYVASLNSKQKKWNLSNYIKCYSATNQMIDYNILVNKQITYNLGYQLTAMIYGGLTNVTSAQMIKAGKFKIVDSKKGDEIAKYMQDIKLNIIGSANSSVLRQFIKTFYHWYNAVDYNHEDFMNYLKNNIDKLMLAKRNGMNEIIYQY